MVRFFTFLLFLFMLFQGCSSPQPIVDNKTETPVEPFPTSSVPREFRAAWVATVANINWPSKPGLSVIQQKAEARKLLDLLVDHHYNAVIFQARPQADALYASSLEPWSYYLSGRQGQAPQPFYDPLAFWIEEAHKRGLELHAWLNPYRAHHPSGGDLTGASLVRQKPELMVPLETGYWWMKPTHPKTQEHTTAVVMDLIRRYDLDGIHFDDYFYPYPSHNNGKDFPDQEDWEIYRANGGNMNKADWRRAAVDTFIHQLYDRIKAEKPHVKFGISPFGIWRPGYPSGIQGFDQYDQLYADARRWFQEGWVDYWTPQLYWPVNQIPQSYPILLDWWADQNNAGRHLWPGMSIGRKSGEAAVDEAINQIMIARGRVKPYPGTVHWSIGPLVNHPNLAESLKKGPYQQPALVPPSPWLATRAPVPPQVETNMVGDSLMVFLQSGDQQPVRRWVLTYTYGKTEGYALLPAQQRQVSLPLFRLAPSFSSTNKPDILPPKEMALEPLTQLQVRAVDKVGLESNPSSAQWPSFTLERAGPLASFFAEAKPQPIRGFQTGWSMLTQQKWSPLQGKRWAILTHSDAWGMDKLPDYLGVAKAVGSHFTGVIDAGQTGLVVKDDLPTKRLENLDPEVIVIDIQNDGTAWDPILSSLFRTLRWCGEHNISVILLDRPNPLGGNSVEGPMLPRAEKDGGPLPVRYGLTVAELAMYWNAAYQLGVPLRTIPMQEWSRDDLWPATGQTWFSTRMDLPSLESVWSQPGIRLLHLASFDPGVKFGRPYWVVPLPSGPTPENIVAGLAPEIDPVAEITLQRITSFDSEEPIFGLWLSPKNIELYQSTRLAAYLLDMLYHLYPDRFDWFSSGITPAPGTPGESAIGVWEEWQKSVADFRQKRTYYFLYKASSP